MEYPHVQLDKTSSKGPFSIAMLDLNQSRESNSFKSSTINDRTPTRLIDGIFRSSC